VIGIPITNTSDVVHDAGAGHGGLALTKGVNSDSKNPGFLFYFNIVGQETLFNNTCACVEYPWPGGTPLLPAAAVGSDISTLMPPPTTGGQAGSWGVVSFQNDPACMLLSFQAADIAVLPSGCTSLSCTTQSVSIPTTPGFNGVPGSCGPPPTGVLPTPTQTNNMVVNLQNNYPGPANLTVTYDYAEWQLGIGYTTIGTVTGQTQASTNPPINAFLKPWTLAPIDACTLNPNNVSGANVVHPCLRVTMNGTPVGAGMPPIPQVQVPTNMTWLPASSIADQIAVHAPPSPGLHNLLLHTRANVVSAQNDATAFARGGPAACSSTDPNRFQPPCCIQSLPGGGNDGRGGVAITAKMAAQLPQCPATPPAQKWETLQYNVTALDQVPGQQISFTGKPCSLYKYYSSVMYRIRHFYSPSDPPYTTWATTLSGSALKSGYVARTMPQPGTAAVVQTATMQLNAGQTTTLNVGVVGSNSSSPPPPPVACCTQTPGASAKYRGGCLFGVALLAGTFGLRRGSRRSWRTRRK
jgi:hypothetical protein